MPRLKVRIVRHNTVVSAQVLRQDEALRGKETLASHFLYKVHSGFSPEILPHTLHVKGKTRLDDCLTVYRPFDTEAEAKDWVRNITALIHEINQEPAQAEPDDGSVEVIVAE